MSLFSALTLVVFFVSSVRLANVWRADLLMVSDGNISFPHSLTKASRRAAVTKYGPFYGKNVFFGRKILLTKRTSFASFISSRCCAVTPISAASSKAATACKFSFSAFTC